MLTGTGYVSDRKAGIVENADGTYPEGDLAEVQISTTTGSCAWRLKQQFFLTSVTFRMKKMVRMQWYTYTCVVRKSAWDIYQRREQLSRSFLTMVNQPSAQADSVGVDFPPVYTSPDTATPLTDI